MPRSQPLPTMSTKSTRHHTAPRESEVDLKRRAIQLVHDVTVGLRHAVELALCHCMLASADGLVSRYASSTAKRRTNLSKSLQINIQQVAFSSKCQLCG